MGVNIEIPGHLLHLVDNNKIIEVEGSTVRECLVNLTRKYPAIAPEVFDINGEMSVIVLHGEVPVDDRIIDRPVSDGDAIRLFPIIIGG